MTKKCEVIPIIGETNAGKSTLVNAIIGKKVSIISRKVQTTIFNIIGVCTKGSSQLIFIDTPGFFKGKNAINLEKKTWEAFRQSSTIIFVVDASKRSFETSLSLLKKIDDKKNVILVLNKVDIVKKTSLLSKIKVFSELRAFAAIFMVSSTTLDGIDVLKNYLLDNAQDGDWLFDEQTTTDQSDETYFAEITREHVYDLLHQELPYNLQIKTCSVERRKHGGTKITQEILIHRDSYKPIVIGHKGEKIKSIGQSARLELQNILGHPVQLFLTVKVEKR